MQILYLLCYILLKKKTVTERTNSKEREREMKSSRRRKVVHDALIKLEEGKK